MNNEPALKGGTLQAMVGALLLVLVSFGLPITAQQQAAISGFLLLVLPFISAYYVRARVTPNERAGGIIQAALEMRKDSSIAELQKSLVESGRPNDAAALAAVAVESAIDLDKTKPETSEK